MQQITPDELARLRTSGENFLLIDVRTPHEHQHFSIGGLHIPLDEVMQSQALIPKDKPVIIYCEKGIRSVIAIQRLERAGYVNFTQHAGWNKSLEKPLRIFHASCFQ